MVDVKQLVLSIGRIAWKAGTHEKVEHQIDAEGNHRIIVTVPAKLAEWQAPDVLTGPTAFRDPSLTWDQIKPPPKKPKK